MGICCTYCPYFADDTIKDDNAVCAFIRYGNNDNDSADIQESQTISISLQIIGILWKEQFQHISIPHFPVLSLHSPGYILAPESDYHSPDPAVALSLLVVSDGILQS